MKFINSNKKGNLSTEELIVIILVALVIVSVLIFIFKADVLKYLRNLPDYSASEGETIDLSELSDEALKSLCPVLVGKIKVETFLAVTEDNFIILCEEPGVSCKSAFVSKLKWTGDENKGVIEVEQLIDDEIGVINNGEITLNKDVFNKESDLYKEVKDDLPEEKYFKSLDSAYYISGNYLCRKLSSNEEGLADSGEEELVELMKYYQKSIIYNFQDESKLCKCKDNCDDYARWIDQYSKEYGIDKLLIISLIMQESQCDQSEISDAGAVGLMQLMKETVEDKSTGCGIVFDDVKNSAEKNIKCGIKILKSKYDNPPFGATVNKWELTHCDSCCHDNSIIKRYVTYTRYEMAVRGYAGWGCVHPYYVENVGVIQDRLEKTIV